MESAGKLLLVFLDECDEKLHHSFSYGDFSRFLDRGDLARTLIIRFPGSEKQGEVIIERMVEVSCSRVAVADDI